MPDSWKLRELFVQGVCLGGYLALMTIIFYWLLHDTHFFEHHFKVHRIAQDKRQETAVIYLQVSTVSQALIFVTRSQGWSFIERPGTMLVVAFAIAQLVATLIAVYAHWPFAQIHGCGWGWAGIVWLYNIVWYLPLDIIKFTVRYILSGAAWDLVVERKIAFTRKKNYGREARQAQWAAIARMPNAEPPIVPSSTISLTAVAGRDLAEKAKWRAEMARLKDIHVLKAHVDVVAKLKGLDDIAIQQSYTI